METLKNILLFPLKLAATVTKIVGRITCGVVGFVLMGGGLALIQLGHLAAAGIPVFLIGLLLLIKAIF